MKNLLLLFIMLVLLLAGCKPQIINNKDIESIIVENISTAQEIEIKDLSQISKLIQIINSSNREFYIFIPEYRITVLYQNNNKVTILVKDLMLKKNGVSYKTSKELCAKIEEYFSKSPSSP